MRIIIIATISMGIAMAGMPKRIIIRITERLDIDVLDSAAAEFSKCTIGSPYDSYGMEVLSSPK